MKGIVIKSTGSMYQVRSDEGVLRECKLKGSFKIKGIKSTNPIAVGDVVEYTFAEGHEIGLIHNIAPRRNYIIRKSVNLSKQTHVIAANVDQALLIVTVAFPRTSTGFIDRFLVTAEAYHIPAYIVFNKIDIIDEELLEYQNHLIDIYTKIGYTCFTVSALQKTNIDVLVELTKGKTTMVSGHSGVGKSALLNAMDSQLDLKTGDISATHAKGKHTTTFAEMHPLTYGGDIIDTPGIKELGLVDFNQGDASHYFIEMRELIHECKFNNCTHDHEPGCAIKKAVEEGEIADFRYINYLNILNNIDIQPEEWE